MTIIEDGPGLSPDQPAFPRIDVEAFTEDGVIVRVHGDPSEVDGKLRGYYADGSEVVPEPLGGGRYLLPNRESGGR